MNVLVVEDQPVVRELLFAVATSALLGSKVQAVADLESGLDAARAVELDVVLLDLGLPGCRGVDAVRRFKAAFPDVLIVVVSSNEDRRVMSEALEAGAVAFLPKGLTPAGLARVLGDARPRNSTTATVSSRFM